MQITEKSRAILEAIAKGHTYEQILVQDLAWTYHDIFQAAAEALEAAKSDNADKSYEVAEIRQEHPRAYEPWKPDEDQRLRQLFQSGATVKQIACTLERQPGAITSRLSKLNLTNPTQAPNQPSP